MQIVVGFPLRWQIPVWRPNSPFAIRGVTSVMVSFGELQQRPQIYESCLRVGLRKHFVVGGDVFLDNGAFRLNRLGVPPNIDAYVKFVQRGRPQWYPVPFDYMPTPADAGATRKRKTRQTNVLNLKYAPLGYVPVVHAGPFVDTQLRALRDSMPLPRLAMGGLVPYLRHLNGAERHDVVRALGTIGREYAGKLHVFGIGGVVSLYIAAMLNASSVDSAGWQVRAVHGVVGLPAAAGQISTRTKHRATFSRRVRDAIRACQCPACLSSGSEGLFERGRTGFTHRSVHNLAMLLNENAIIEHASASGRLRPWIVQRFRASPYSGLVSAALDAI